MKVLVLGGVTIGRDEISPGEEQSSLERSMAALGIELAGAGHELIVCSPFDDSADVHALRGFDGAGVQGRAEIHYPLLDGVGEAVRQLAQSLSSTDLQPYEYNVASSSSVAATQENLRYAWLLAQLRALDSSAALVVAGGRPGGSLSMILQLASGKGKVVLPLGFLGGASLDYLNVRYWELTRALGPEAALRLQSDTAPTGAIELLERLARVPAAPGDVGKRPTFFVSYARARPAEADFVEMLLRRGGHAVFRDERGIEPAEDIPDAILRNIRRASIFVAIWCVEYACSPWCTDEFEVALQRREEGLCELWILCVDDTRMVPKAARALTYYPVRTRGELEGRLLDLIDRFTHRDEP